MVIVNEGNEKFKTKPNYAAFVRKPQFIMVSIQLRKDIWRLYANLFNVTINYRNILKSKVISRVFDKIDALSRFDPILDQKQ